MVLIVLPALGLITTYAAFQAYASTFGPVPGYLPGLLFHWSAGCLAVPLWLLGAARVRALFQAQAGMSRLLLHVGLLACPQDGGSDCAGWDTVPLKRLGDEDAAAHPGGW